MVASITALQHPDDGTERPIHPPSAAPPSALIARLNASSGAQLRSHLGPATEATEVTGAAAGTQSGAPTSREEAVAEALALFEEFPDEEDEALLVAQQHLETSHDARAGGGAAAPPAPGTPAGGRGVKRAGRSEAESDDDEDVDMAALLHAGDDVLAMLPAELQAAVRAQRAAVDARSVLRDDTAPVPDDRSVEQARVGRVGRG